MATSLGAYCRSDLSRIGSHPFIYPHRLRYLSMHFAGAVLRGPHPFNSAHSLSPPIAVRCAGRAVGAAWPMGGPWGSARDKRRFRMRSRRLKYFVSRPARLPAGEYTAAARQNCRRRHSHEPHTESRHCRDDAGPDAQHWPSEYFYSNPELAAHYLRYDQSDLVSGNQGIPLPEPPTGAIWARGSIYRWSRRASNYSASVAADAVSVGF